MSKLFSVRKHLMLITTGRIPLSTTPPNKPPKGGRGSKRPYKPHKLQTLVGIIPVQPKLSHKSKSLLKDAKANNPETPEDSPVPPQEKTKKKKKRMIFANVGDDGLPLLNPKDCFRRVEFASKMLELFAKNPDVLESIIFSDEGNFNLSKQTGNSNSKSKKPKETRKHGESKPMPQIVWCGMTSQYLIGPYFFNSYVTERTYLKMLQKFLIPQLQTIGGSSKVRTPWYFQQDGNPPHRTRKAIKYLTDHFGARLISHGAAIAWPPKSQDLTPLDYFLWGYLKDKLESNYLPHELSTKEAFRKGLIHQVDEIDQELLAKVINQFPLRLEKCVEMNGERFDFDEEL